MKDNLLTQEIVRELIDYDKETGVARWKVRNSKWWVDGYRTAQGAANNWNSIYAGKEISSTTTGGYIQVYVLGKNYYLHRIIFLWVTGEWPNFVDHINGNRGDNRWENLRSVDKIDNSRNIIRPKTNKSGCVGVINVKGKWQARIYIADKNIYLGSYETKEEAIKRRKDAERHYGFHENHGKERI